MNRLLMTFSLLLTLTRLSAQDAYYAVDPLVVTAHRFPVRAADVSRAVTVIDSAEIRRSPYTSVQELLLHTAGVDLQRRGPEGVQADVSVRGASFEGTLILIDGVPVNDCQTAHHNLNLPLSTDDVERIEVVRGSLSGLYGADAVGGVIHIITKNGGRSTAELSAGSFGYYRAAAALAGGASRFSFRLSGEKKRSDGYAPATDFDQSNLFLKTAADFGTWSFRWSAGYNDKAFGANAFYSSLFPNEWEHTRTLLSTVAVDLKQPRWTFTPRLLLRRHDDDFMLDRARPDFYRNTHVNRTIQAELPIQWSTPIGRLAFFSDWKLEQLNSSALGDRRRQSLGLCAAFNRTLFDRFDINPTFYGHYTSEWGWRAWPGVDAGVHFGRFKLFAAVHSAFRAPSFTELYYQSPANIGNPRLRPESATTTEIGGSLRGGSFTASLSFFRRSARELIDWVRDSSGEPWRAVNIGRLQTFGPEAQLSLTSPGVPTVERLSLGAAHISASKQSAAPQSKYALRHLKNQMTLTVDHRLPGAVRFSWSLQYRERCNEKPYTLLDAGAARSFGRLQVFFKSLNLLNTTYSDFVGVPMPGRQWTVGIKLNDN